jgi:hypothetical protein
MINPADGKSQLRCNNAAGSSNHPNNNNNKKHHTPSRRFLMVLFGLGLVSVFAVYHFICIGLSALFFKLHVMQQEQKRDVSHPAYYSKVYKKDSHLLPAAAAAAASEGTTLVDSLDTASNSSNNTTTSTVALLKKKRIGGQPDMAIPQAQEDTKTGGD